MMKERLQIVWVFIVFSVSLHHSSAQELDLPIEVFRIKTNDDPEIWDNTAERRLDLGNFDQGELWLFLQVNNLNAAASMEYRIKQGNGAYGPWQACRPDWTAFPKDRAYGGLNGGFATTAFSTPLSGARANGENTIMFRFLAQPNEATSGYRIIRIALRSSNTKNAPDLIITPRNNISGAAFEGPFMGDPNRAAMAQEGKKLWMGTVGNNLLDRNKNPIQAKCTHCHTQDGSDLKYFNYSNKSIIARSNFHGLTKEEGQQIAQYIRDLNMDRSKNGRPWEPPYQPGPSADTDAREWAAGQGLDAVLETDLEMMEPLFGSKEPSKTQVQNTIAGFEGNTNIRTMPISVQFPDWNMWMPEEHPMDQRDVSAQWPQLNTAYQNLRNKLNTPEKVVQRNTKTQVFKPFLENGVVEAFGVFAAEVHKVVIDLPGSSWAEVSGVRNQIDNGFPVSPVWAENVNNNYSETSKRREKAKQSIAFWYSTKLFEIIQEFELYQLRLNNVPANDLEPFQWPIREWSVFQNAAHIIGANRNDSYFESDAGSEDDKTRGIYLSSIWYQVQLTLTPGHRRGSNIGPNDFAYNLQHIHRLGARSGIYEPSRFFQNYLKTGEQRNNGTAPVASSNNNGNVYPGWNMRELSPWRLYSTGKGDRRTFTETLSPTTRLAIQEAFMDETMRILEGFGDNWNRIPIETSGKRYDYELENRGALPLDGSANPGDCLFLDRRSDCNDSNDAVEIDAFFTLLRKLRQDGEISCAVFDRIRNWAIARWDYPEPNWPRCGTVVPIEYRLNIENGTGAGTYIEGTAVTVSANVPNGTVFDKWTGDTQFLNDTETPTAQLTMPPRNVSITATFKNPAPENYVLNVTDGNGSGEYPEGTTVTVSANIPNGTVFDKWTGDTQFLNDTETPTAQLTIPPRNVSITATFKNPAPENYVLNVTGGNGSGEYPEGTTVTILAIVPDGMVFDQWTGDTQFITDLFAIATQLQMPSQNIVLKPLFTTLTPTLFKLEVINGTGSGSYREGEQVTIAPLLEESEQFVVWKGDTIHIADSMSPIATFTMPDKSIRLEALIQKKGGDSIIVYPNPAKDYLYVEHYTGGPTAPRVITLWTLGNKLVRVIPIDTLLPGNNEIFIGDLQNAVYILKYSSFGFDKSVKITVQH